MQFFILGARLGPYKGPVFLPDVCLREIICKSSFSSYT